MDEPKYKTPAAFRVALEARLLSSAKQTGTPVNRLRFLVVSDRFLARLTTYNRTDWTLKGGYAMELRMDQARTTKDIDLSLRMYGKLPPASELGLVILEKLVEAANIDLGDHFAFTVAAPVKNVENAVYGGAQFPVTAWLNGKVFERFRVDVVVGDPPQGEEVQLVGKDWLGFAHIEPVRISAIRAEQQFAEKLHAYTFPRPGSPNSRVKDLIDMLLLIKRADLSGSILAASIQATFARRATHDVPKSLPAPPQDWPKPFATMAAECRLEESLQEGYEIVELYLRDVLPLAAKS